MVVVEEVGLGVSFGGTGAGTFSVGRVSVRVVEDAELVSVLLEALRGVREWVEERGV